MLHRCPRCHQPTLPSLQVRWSSRESPAACSACGALSHVLASTASGIWLLELMVVVGALLAGAIAGFWPLGLLSIPLAVAHNRWAWRRVQLWPISAQSVKRARKANGWLMVASLLFALFR